MKTRKLEQSNRVTYTQIDIGTDSQMDKQPDRPTNTWPDKQMDKQTDTLPQRWRARQMNEKNERWTGTNRQRDTDTGTKY